MTDNNQNEDNRKATKEERKAAQQKEYYDFMNKGSDKFVVDIWNKFSSNFTPIFFGLFIQILFSGFVFYMFQNILITMFSGYPEIPYVSPATSDIVIFTIVYLIGTVLILSGALNVYKEISEKDSAKVSDFFRGILKYPLRLLIQNLMLTCMVLVLGFITIFISSFGTIMMLLGFALSVIIFIFIYPFYIMAQPILVSENCGVIQSLKISAAFGAKHANIIFLAAFFQIFGTAMLNLVFGLLSIVFLPYFWYSIGAAVVTLINLFMMLVYFDIYSRYKDGAELTDANTKYTESDPSIDPTKDFVEFNFDDESDTKDKTV